MTMPNVRRSAGALALLSVLASLLCAGAAAEDSIQLYRAASPAGRVSYFYPSFHLPDARIVRPPVAVLDAMRTLVVEASMVEMAADPGAMARYALNPAPLDLAALFTAGEIATMRERAACHGASDRLEQLRLFIVAAMITLPCPAPGAVANEQIIEREARARDLRIVALETPDEEFAALNSLPDRVFIEAIKTYVGDPEAGDRLSDRMIELYNAGRYDALYDATLETAPEDEADRQLFIEAILTGRNRIMVERMADTLAEGDALIIIGALHFPRGGGIIDLLERQGFRITMIDAASGRLR